MHVLSHSFVFPLREKCPECHASTLVRTPGGMILCAWFGGTHEKHDDVGIWMSRFDGTTWEPQRQVQKTPDVPCWNPVLFALSDRTLLFYKSGKEITAWKTLVSESFDDGKTWSAPRELVPGDKGGRGPVKNKPIRLKNGNILAPSSLETESAWDCFTDLSSDEGMTWEKSPFVPLDHQTLTGKGIIQPSLWEDSSGLVHMFMRSSEGKIFTSTSRDGGKSWEKALPTDLPNNNSGLDLTRTDNGDLYLVCNPVSENWGPRTPLVLMKSADNAQHFETLLTLDHVPCDRNEKDAEFSYPSIISFGNDLYVTYTWKRQSVAFWHIQID